MLRRIINRLFEFCSLQAPKDAGRNNMKAGFTIIELMVVIVIVNLLSGVAVPKLTDLIEKTRERIDLMKLYHLRDALDRALYEDDVHNIQEGNKCGSQTTSSSDLDKFLSEEKGVSLFVIERHSVLPSNYQGVHRNATGNNMCGLIYDGGFWNTALKESGFEAVAAIVADRAAGDNNIKTNSPLYTAQKMSPASGTTWTRTYPTKPIFVSKALGSDYRSVSTNQSRLTMRVRWKDCNPDSHSLDVFFLNETTQNPLIGGFTTFSTMNDFKCPAKKKNK